VHQDKANVLLTRFTIANVLPQSVIDDKAFREFMNFLEPKYQVACWQTFCAWLNGLKKSVKSEMASASSVATTTDIWTSIASEPHVSLTASYITAD